MQEPLIDPPVDITDEALEQFGLKIAARGQTTGIRFGVRGGACNGFSYQISYEDDEPRPTDAAWSKGDIIFMIDKKSLIYLRGCRIVWKGSLLWTGFDFENPVEASRCGCGASFSVK